jgi:hypothetical protein
LVSSLSMSHPIYRRKEIADTVPTLPRGL